MSDYLTKAKRPGSDEWEPVEMRDNYYGPHNYGVQFPDGHVYPDGDCEIIGEKPGETWEERLYALGNECSFDWDGAPERLESFIASEIQSAVEAERRRIAVAMEGERLNEMDSWDVSSKKVLSIINPKK